MELNKPIRHAKISRDMTVEQLVDSLSGCAFGQGAFMKLLTYTGK